MHVAAQVLRLWLFLPLHERPLKPAPELLSELLQDLEHGQAFAFLHLLRPDNLPLQLAPSVQLPE